MLLLPFIKTEKSSQTRHMMAVSQLLKAMSIVLFTLNFSACSTMSERTEEPVAENSEVNPELASDTNEILNTEKDAEVTSDAVEPQQPSGKNLFLAQQQANPIVVSKAVDEKYQQALILIDKKKWQQAHKLLDEVIALQPELSGSYVNKALIYKKNKAYAKAHEQLDIAISVNKLNLYAHHIQGQIYRLEGSFEKAEVSYKAALAIWPDFAQAQLSMAVLLELYRGRLQDAYRYYHAYLALEPDDKEVQRWLAGLEIKMKRAGVEKPEITAIKQESDIASSEGKTEETQVANEQKPALTEQGAD